MASSRPTLSDVLAQNLRATRERRRLTVKALSERLTEVGYPVIATGITKAETADGSRRRRITTDELAALALVLDTSPAFLLTPPSEDELVAVTPEVAALGVWVGDWMRGETWLQRAPDDLEGRGASHAARDAAFLEAAPERHRRRARIGVHPVVVALAALETHVRDALDPQGRPTETEPAEVAEALRREIERLRTYVRLLADEVEQERPRG